MREVEVKCELGPCRNESQPFTSCRSHSLSEDWTHDLISRSIEGIHRSLHPKIKDFSHELSNCVLCLRAGGIVRYRSGRHSRHPTACPSGYSGGLMQQHEAYIGTGEKAADMGACRRIVVDDLEPHVRTEPLDLFHDVKRRMHNELVHVSRCFAVPESSDAISTSLGRAKCQLKQRRVCRRNYYEVIRHSHDVRLPEASPNVETKCRMAT